MKKMKRIVTLLMTVVMMMAMSVTAFAAPKKSASFTVTNLANDEATTLKIYEIAKPGNGEWTFATWIPEDLRQLTEKTDDEGKKYYEYDFNWAEIAVLAESQTPTLPAYTTTATNGVFETSHTFTGLTGSAYLVLAAGTEYVYSPMGKATYEYVNGAYTLKDETVVAKSSNIPVKKTIKEDEDKFVKIGQTVTFEIKTNIPNENESFTITDQPTNLNDLTITGVTRAGLPVKDTDDKDFAFVEQNDGTFVVNLTSLLGDEFVGDTVIITVTGVVGSDVVLDSKDENGEVVPGYAFKNVAFSNKSKPNSSSEVIGYTGDATLTKRDNATQAVLSGAEFKVVTKKTVNDKLVVDSTLKFVEVSDGVYKLSTAQGAEELIKAPAGTVQVIGLEEGTYYFQEVTAPTGYSLADDVEFEIEESFTTNKSAYKDMFDTTLIKLPFTGGMGTTIFTVLGVAIMAIAAALFFATKKSKN